MTRWTRAGAAVGFFVTAGLWLAGCGSDTAATVIVPGTPSPTVIQRVGTPVPTATPIPGRV